MGHEVSRTFKLEWPETHFLHGALVRMRSSPIGLTLRIRSGEMPWEDLVKALCDHVVAWDLECNGVPLEIMPEEVIARVDKPVLVDIAKAWQDASNGVTAPLDSASSDGQASPDTEELVQSIPMETP